MRSYLIHNQSPSDSTRSYDPSADIILPLHCLGAVAAWDGDDLACDFWLGPTGDHIFHFHRPYASEPTLVGRPPHIRPSQLDPGVVFVGVVGSNPEWLPILSRSVGACFVGAAVHYLNASPTGEAAPWPPVPENRKALLCWVRGQPLAQKLNLTLSLHFGDRFLAKLALGFGAIALAPSFLRSEEASLLRRSLWTKESEDRDSIAIRGQSFLGAMTSGHRLSEVLNWNACHFFLLQRMAGAVILSSCFYGRYDGSIALTDRQEHFDGRVDRDGIMWVLAPGLRRVAGPMSLPEFVAAREADVGGSPLDDLRARLASARPFPPFHLPGQQDPR